MNNDFWYNDLKDQIIEKYGVKNGEEILLEASRVLNFISFSTNPELLLSVSEVLMSVFEQAIKARELHIKEAKTD